MRKAILALFLCGCGAVSAQQLAADESVTATEIALCQARARTADAGDHVHAYNVCMSTFGLHDGGVK